MLIVIKFGELLLCILQEFLKPANELEHKSLVQYHGFKTAEQSVQHLALAASISTGVISYLASFFVDDCFYNRGQTSRPVVRAQIQTSSNFGENIRNSAVFWVVSIFSSTLSLWNSVIQ